MQFSVSNEHIQYFNKNAKIEFENLLDPSQIKILLSHISLMKLQKESFRKGLDLWRKEDALKSFIIKPTFAKIAGQLKNQTDLRYAYSQYLGPDCFSNDASLLYRKSCIKELLIGLCLCLEPSEEQESPFFPKKAGEGLFFDIDPDFYLLFPEVKGKYLFIFYADIKARFYLLKEDTKLEEAFRNLGYEHGDFLRDKLNPPYHRIPV